jgi:hypothetical protein
MIKYVGDLSKADAYLLARLARESPCILEFGAGASTMIFAQAVSLGGSITCVETSPWWIEATQKKLIELENAVRVMPKFYTSFDAAFSADFPTILANVDLIFDDGIDEQRRSFALHTWGCLVPGGAMAFHDTRRISDVRNVLALIEAKFESIGDVSFNAEGSNITIVHKRRVSVRYENWHDVEGKQRWQSGYEPTPEDWLNVAPKIEIT